MADTVDTSVAVKDILFDSENNERRSWIFFGHRANRSQVVFLVQVLLVLTIVIVSIVNLTLAKTCEETSIWIAILSSSVGYMLPSPRI